MSDVEPEGRAGFFTNLVIQAHGTVTNPPASAEASCQAEGTVTNPEDKE